MVNGSVQDARLPNKIAKVWLIRVLQSIQCRPSSVFKLTTFTAQLLGLGFNEGRHLVAL